jgi:O-antigen/teichoic acid export membrane protein
MLLSYPTWRKRLNFSPLVERIIRGCAWSLAGAVLSRGLGLIALIVVARFLGKETFGELCIIQNTITTLSAVVAIGLAITATKHVAECRGSDPARAGRIITLSLLLVLISSTVCTAVLWVLSGAFAARVLAAPELKTLLQIGLLGLIPASVNGVQIAVLGGFEAFKAIARISGWTGLMTFGLVLGGVAVGGVAGVVWANVLAGVITCWLCQRPLRRCCAEAGISLRQTGLLRELGVLWRFSLPAWLSSLMTGPVLWLANLILVNQPQGYAELGVYNAVLRIKQIPEMILGMVLLPLLPVLSEAYGRQSGSRCQTTLRYAFAVSVCVMVPISLIQIALPELTLAIYGQSYRGQTAVVQWLMVHAIAVGLFQPFGSILASSNRMWFGWVYNLLWAALFLGGAGYLVPRYGAAGLACALAGSHVASSVVCVAYMYRFERPLVTGFGLGINMLAVAACVAIVAFGARSLNPTLTIVLASVTAGALVWQMTQGFLRPWWHRLAPTQPRTSA